MVWYSLQILSDLYFAPEGRIGEIEKRKLHLEVFSSSCTERVVAAQVVGE